MSSAVILSIAFVINQNFPKWANFISTDFNTTPQILMAIGIVVFLIAIIGLYGLIRDSGRLLRLFSILLTIVLIGEFVLSGVAYHMKGNIKEYVLDQMNSTFSVYNKTGYDASTFAWDVLQTENHCCGIHGSKDWQPFTHNDELPESCCMFIPEDEFCISEYSWMNGCYTNLVDISQSLILTAIVFVFIQLLAVFLSWYIKYSIHQEYQSIQK